MSNQKTHTKIINHPSLHQPLAGRFNRSLSLALAIGLAILALTLLALPTFSGGAVSADGPDEGLVVVVFPEERAVARPISYTAGISRPIALSLTGLDVVSIGDAICAIEGVGCPEATDIGSCFCPDNFWHQSQWSTADGAWDDQTWPPPAVADGDIIGFRWSRDAFGPPKLPGPAYSAAVDGLAWLGTLQSADDGSYGGSTSSSLNTLLTIGANGIDARTWQQTADSPSLFSFILGRAANYSQEGGDSAGKMALGLDATWGCLPFGSQTPLAFYNPADGSFTGSFSVGTGPQSWSILGTLAAGQTVPEGALQYLRDTRQANGGWEWQPGFGSDTNATAIALQALLAAGEPVSATSVISGLAYLAAAQNTDGGFPYTPEAVDPPSDTNSTAWVVQALLAAGEDPTGPDWTVDESTPLDFLLDRQQADGSFEWLPGEGTDLMASQQAIPALLGRSQPYGAVTQSAYGSGTFTVGNLSTCQATYLPVVSNQE